MALTARPLRRLVWVILLWAVVGLTGCKSVTPAVATSPSPSVSPSSTGRSAEESVAVVGGKSITRSELTDRLMASYGSEALREMMLREAMDREAAASGLTVTDKELEQELRSMREGYDSESQFYEAMRKQLGLDKEAVREDASYRLLLEKLAARDVRISETDIERYYKEHEGDYGSHRQFEAAWILTAAKEDADAVLAELEKGSDFGMLAGRYSVDDLTTEAGGYLGWVDENDSFQDPKLLAAAGNLNVGEVAGPIRTDAGYAIVELKGRKVTQRRELSAVRDEIRRQLAMEQATSIREVEQWLLAKYDAKVLDSRLKAAANP